VAVGKAPELPHVVLDAEDRVLDVSPSAPAPFPSLLGKRVHDGFPETGALYAPYYERARRTGEVVEFTQYSDGHVTLMKAVPTRRVLIVSWELIGFIDVMTIESLRDSIDAVLDALSKNEEVLHRERARFIKRNCRRRLTGTSDFYVVDAGDRLVQVSDGLRETMTPFLGNSLWECFPRADEIFGGHFDEARESECEVEFKTFYAGAAMRLRVVPAGESLTVYPERLVEVNVRTLGTLTESLQRIEAALADPTSEQPDPPARASLRALP